MAWEYEGLFDAIPNSGDMLHTFWTKEETEIRAGCMGYRTQTTKAGPRLEAEIYPLFGREKTGRLRAAKKNETPERQRKQNEIRAKRRLILLMEENFRVWEDLHVTLTWAGEEPTEKVFRQAVSSFFRKVRKIRAERKLEELKYLYAIGYDADHRIHAHVILNSGIGRDELERIWGRGISNALRLQDYGGGIQGMANYLYRQREQIKKTPQGAGLRSWAGSRNLRKPKVHTSDSKFSNQKVKKIAYNFRNEAKTILEKTYPGYVLQDCRVCYSDVVDGVYIRCVMRRWEEVER